ncbi:MAG: thiamine pyrophosphate-binding protein [Desulfurococcales archaeon]|nr:thiamine pyrophosphate-binding protein [Desulfurococcales archaeon]
MAGINRVADYIAEYLKALGVKRIYGIIGTSVVDFVDALYDRRSDLRYVSVRHEQVAVAMADAEYRSSGQLSAALVHAGPGFLNSLISLGVAYKDKVPLILLSGGVKRRLYGTDSWLEVDQQSIAKSLTRATVRIDDPEDLERSLGYLVRTAFTPPRGPVLLEVPEDLWSKPVPASRLPGGLSDLIPEPAKPPVDIVKEVLGDLVRASKPLIYATGECVGDGVNSVIDELAERLGAYVVTSGNGRGACSEVHPRCLGRVGFGGGSLPADKAFESADYILVLGDELDDIATYAYTVYPEGDIDIVSENPVVEKRPIYYTRLVKASPYHFALMLLEEARKSGVKEDKKEWDGEIAGYKSAWEGMLEEAVERRYEGFANPSLFFKKLNDRIDEDTIITGGQGTHIVYTYDFLRITKPGRFLAATNLGAMGYAFPAALGAKLANPESEVIAVVGDGEFMMTLQDLETAVREGIPVKVIVVNDNSYRVLLLRQKMQKSGRVYGTIHTNPSFEALARAFGAEGTTVGSDEEIDSAIRDLLEADKPFVLDLLISPEDLPPLNLEGSLRMAGG